MGKRREGTGSARVEDESREVASPEKARGTSRSRGRAASPPVDWEDAARLLAVGLSPSEVAQLVGTTPGRVSARLKRVKSFREMVEHFRAQSRASPRQAYERLCRLVYAHLERQVRCGNLRVLLWIADRLKLVRPAEVDVAEAEVARLIEGLSESQREELARLAGRD